MPTITYERPDPPGEIALWRLEVDGRVLHFRPGAARFSVAEANEAGYGPWSDPVEVIFLPEPPVGLGLAATLLTLAVLSRWRSRG